MAVYSYLHLKDKNLKFTRQITPAISSLGMSYDILRKIRARLADRFCLFGISPFSGRGLLASIANNEEMQSV